MQQRAIKKNTRKSSPKPVPPSAVAGYSGTPLPKKLGIRESSFFLLVNPPDHFERKLEPLPPGAQLCEQAEAANVAVLFTNSEAELVRDFRSLAKALPQRVALWVAWPKKASGVKTDLSEDIIRDFGLGCGWVDYKVCAIDQTWSGLCFARRKK